MSTCINLNHNTRMKQLLLFIYYCNNNLIYVFFNIKCLLFNFDILQTFTHKYLTDSTFVPKPRKIYETILRKFKYAL